MTRFLILSITLAALPVAARAADTTRGPRDAIFPTQSIPLAFDHAVHLTRAKAKCVDCHDMQENVRPADRGLPPEATCLDCHDVTEENPEKASPPAACSTCHPGYFPTFPAEVSRDETTRATPHPAPVDLGVAAVRFSHKAHLTRGAACAACHKGVDTAGLATVDHLPMMDRCIACHDGRQAPGTCATCHLAGPDGRLVTDLPGGKLVPRGLFRNDDHRGDFARTHGPAAKTDATYCKNCHTESECARCHTGSVKPLSLHAADYILTHPPEARRDDPQCSRCHRLQTFCADCHLRSGVTQEGPGNFRFNAAGNATGKLHPAGWATRPEEGPLTGAHHKFEARRNIRACVACHQEETCTACHATGGFSPHPRNFRDACGRLRSVAERGCRKCHPDAAQLDALCGG